MSSFSNFKLMYFTVAIYVAYLCHIDSQYVTIWSDSMEQSNNWLLPDFGCPNSCPMIEFGSDSSYCSNSPCLLLDSAQSWAYVERTTDVTDYSSIKLQFSVAKANTNTGADFCEIWYNYDGSNTFHKLGVYHIASATQYSSTFIPPESDKLFTLRILSTIHVTLAYDAAQCYFDELVLFGIPLISHSPTIIPTYIPTITPTYIPTMDTFHPSDSPTYFPSIDPTFSPIHDPRNAPSSNPYIEPTTAPNASPVILSEGKINDISSTQNEYSSTSAQKHGKKIDTWLVWSICALIGIIALFFLCRFVFCFKKEIRKKSAAKQATNRIQANVVQVSSDINVNHESKESNATMLIEEMKEVQLMKKKKLQEMNDGIPVVGDVDSEEVEAEVLEEGEFVIQGDDEICTRNGERETDMI